MRNSACIYSDCCTFKNLRKPIICCYGSYISDQLKHFNFPPNLSMKRCFPLWCNWKLITKTIKKPSLYQEFFWTSTSLIHSSVQFQNSWTFHIDLYRHINAKISSMGISIHYIFWKRVRFCGRYEHVLVLNEHITSRLNAKRTSGWRVSLLTRA